MKTVELWRGVEPCVIVPDSTGIAYTNQVGGHACNQPEAEGFIVPIRISDAQAKLHEHFTGPLHDGWCYKGITDVDADYIDEMLSPIRIYVDRSKLAESCEAWVHVLIGDPDEVGIAAAAKPGASAILTWNNSD